MKEIELIGNATDAQKKTILINVGIIINCLFRLGLTGKEVEETTDKVDNWATSLTGSEQLRKVVGIYNESAIKKIADDDVQAIIDNDWAYTSRLSCAKCMSFANYPAKANLDCCPTCCNKDARTILRYYGKDGLPSENLMKH